MKNKEISIKVSKALKGRTRSDEYKKEMSEKIKNSEKHKSRTQNEKNRDAHREIQRDKMKSVIQYDMNMNYIAEYESMGDKIKYKKRLRILCNKWQTKIDKWIYF